ncbi:MAG TPA: DNA polymerase I [Firmicutes bacterium]|nr:DNA polymerase I [Bacillota bacterium]
MKLLVVDSNSLLNRAFFAIKLLTTKDGTYTNAIYGFLNIMLKVLEDCRPDGVAFAFDLKAPTFRHKLYDGYKAQRKGMPPELASQLPILKELLTLMGYPLVSLEGYEADDILGTLAKGCRGEDRCVIATGDRDSLQLVDEQVSVLLAGTKLGMGAYTLMDPSAIWAKYGVAPQQLVDVKALMGDTSDNIPGVPGIGEKTALALISRYETMDEVYRQLEAGTLEATPSVKRKLAEGKDLALLSRELARIDIHVPVDADPHHYQKQPGDPAALYRLLARLELFTVIQRLGLEAPAGQETGGEDAPVPQALAVQQGADPASLAGKKLALLPLGPVKELEGLAACDGETVFLWEGRQAGEAALTALLEGEGEKLALSSKELFRFALWKGLSLGGKMAFDGELAAYLLNPNSSDYSLERLCGEYAVPAPALSLPEDAPEETAKAAGQGGSLWALCQGLEGEIARKEQQGLLSEIEIPLAQVLASMEEEGFAIDLPALEAFGRELDGEINRLQEEIYQMAGCTFNINSPKQLGDLLFGQLELPHGKKTKSGYSTNAEILEGLREYHPIVGAVLDYRKYTKLKSTYVEGLSKQVGPDGRIHSVFNQTETRTGRISSAEPNLQNIPIRTPLGARMRAFFPAREGCLLIDADYSQIELRVLASIAGDQNMIDAFLAGEDIHTNTAAQVFDLPPLFVTPLMRSRAKAVNFGIVYGISAFSLSKDIGVTVAEADRYIKNYLKTYSGVRHYMEESVAKGKEQGYVSTLFGRRRYLPELASTNRNLRAFGERVAMNAPIQGTAADIIKIAMVRVWNRLREEGLQARLVLQVHDELIVEAPEEEAERASQIVREAMEQAAQLKVPLVVDLGTGKTWQEAH